jgi:release factor glutamine methyltransferase
MLTYAELRRDLAIQLARFLPVEEAQAESWLWLEDGLGWDRSRLVARGEEAVPEADRERVGHWLRRRREGEPWAYLLGWSTFRDRRFKVTPATLIPRPETELLVEAALDVGRRLGLDRCVDVGTGSGIIAVSLALETDWAVSATEISPEALVVARENAATLGATVAFLMGNLLDPLPDPLSMVVANLPYVDPADRPLLQRELAFEPETALFALDRGLKLSTDLLTQARERKVPACLLEIGAGQGGELCRRALGTGWRKSMIHQDLAGHDRVLIALA